MRFSNYDDAMNYLIEKGMKLHYVGLGGDTDREYWWFEGELNSLLDHSATITVYRDCSLVSDFTDLPRRYDWNKRYQLQ